jgi:hypothetical protein
VAGSCEYGDEPSVSSATELVSLLVVLFLCPRVDGRLLVCDSLRAYKWRQIFAGNAFVFLKIEVMAPRTEEHRRNLQCRENLNSVSVRVCSPDKFESLDGFSRTFVLTQCHYKSHTIAILL